MKLIIGMTFRERLERVDAVVARAISMYETLLEQQEKVHQKTLEQREAENAWLGHQSLELERLKNKVATVCWRSIS
ncbi:MAG: hypothetical protein KME42_08440 [Tildeniella nuda ZEHNDER 1965/U140]|jgi:sensor histidine kinase YesM|nr:hypothetical protein [Tildeniella nuda ZEHNDER 1965/U140]